MSTTGVIERCYFAAEGYLCYLDSWLLLLFLQQSSFCKIYQINELELALLIALFRITYLSLCDVDVIFYTNRPFYGSPIYCRADGTFLESLSLVPLLVDTTDWADTFLWLPKKPVDLFDFFWSSVEVGLC